MTILTLTDREISGQHPREIVGRLRETAWTPARSNREYMRQFSRRARTLKPSAHIRTWSAKTFISDAHREGFLEVKEVA